MRYNNEVSTIEINTQPRSIGVFLIPTQTAATGLYRRLRDAGFTKHYVKKVAALPTWWDDQLWDDAASKSVGMISLARHLGIDIATLQDDTAAIRLKHFGVCKYKKRTGTKEEELELSRVIATRAAQLAITAMSKPYLPLPSALDIRDQILEREPWVDFRSLLDFCWSSGLPVVHVSNFPIAAKKKPMGFTMQVHDRPAIVLCENNKYEAKQLFVLAHELGHLFHQHIPENGAMFDEGVNENSHDREEKEADQFALELITGNRDQQFAIGRWPKADLLAESARDFASRNKVDPGHVVLNVAHGNDSLWPLVTAALKILYPKPNALGILSDSLAANLDWEQLPEDSSEFLMRITRQENAS